MNSIIRTQFGYKLTFGGFIQAPEMEQWVSDSKKALVGHPAEFGVFVDMRTLKPLAPEAQVAMQQGQVLYKQSGMQRSVVIVNDAITAMQFRRIARTTGIDAWERYVDASARPDWESVGLKWLVDKVDPDKA